MAVGICSCSSVNSLFDEKEEVFEGERISVLELEKELEPDDYSLKATGFVAPSPWQNEFWPQRGGYPNHSMQHLALKEGEMEKKWSVNIGKGASKRLPLTTQPVVVDGKVFTLDNDSVLSAFDVENGKRLWRSKVRDLEEDDPVISGGVAFSGGTLYVTAGYDEILAIDPENGEIVNRFAIPAPSRAAPSVLGGRIFVSTLDNRLLALGADNGQIIWEHSALGESIGLIGAASPAVNQDVVVPVFSSGEIFALRVENGSVAWSDNLASLNSVGGLSSISDITGLPVIDKGLVIAISFGGKMVAIDERTGSRVWQREISGSETPWVAGNMVFITSSNNKLVALGRDNGAINWVVDLNKDNDDKNMMWTAPVFAGGRLIVVSSDGEMASFNPESGELVSRREAGSGFSVAPVIAAGVLYLLDNSGRLTAYN